MEREPNAENASSGGPCADSSPPSTERDKSAIETERPISRGSKLVGPLPVARGAQNYFLGEMEDSFTVGAIPTIYYLLRPGFQRETTAMSRLVPSAAMFRTYYVVVAASFVFFASLSATGVNYPRPFPIMFEDAGLKQEVMDGREEASTKKLTAIGAILGVAAATRSTRSDNWPELKSFGGRFLPLKKIPMGLGIICSFAGGMSLVGTLFQREDFFGSKASPEA